MSLWFQSQSVMRKWAAFLKYFLLSHRVKLCKPVSPEKQLHLILSTCKKKIFFLIILRLFLNFGDWLAFYGFKLRGTFRFMKPSAGKRRWERSESFADLRDRLQGNDPSTNAPRTACGVGQGAAP